MSKFSKSYQRSRILNPRLCDMLLLKVMMYEDFLTRRYFDEHECTNVQLLYSEYLELTGQLNALLRIQKRPLWRSSLKVEDLKFIPVLDDDLPF